MHIPIWCSFDIFAYVFALTWMNKNLLKLYTPPKKVLGHLCLPLLRLLLWWVSGEALSISHSVLINEVSFVGKSMPRIMNFNSLRWVLKYLISCTHSKKYLIASQQTSHGNNAFHVNLRFVQNVIQTINPVHFTKFGMQQNCLCHELYPGSSNYCLN